MRIITDNTIYETEAPEKGPIYINVYFQDMNGSWIEKPIRAMLDSGSAGGVYLPASLVKRLNLNVSVIGPIQSEMADSSLANGLLGRVSIMLKTIPDNKAMTLDGLPASIGEGQEVLIGMECLYFCHVGITRGELKRFQFNADAIQAALLRQIDKIS